MASLFCFNTLAQRGTSHMFHLFHVTYLKVGIVPVGIIINYLLTIVYIGNSGIFALVPCSTYTDFKVAFCDKKLSVNLCNPVKDMIKMHILDYISLPMRFKTP